jgi:hypothetical protein|tara:strand:+ start:441 stop:797 length:357 start_codon:yes stop_codon:yes gene_type:complete
MFNLKGDVLVVGDEQVISPKFTKRELVVEDNSGQYPQQISFQVTQDRMALLDPLKKGDQVNVYFNLRGREWTSPKDGQVKYFNTLEAWKIESVGEAAPAVIPPAASASGGEDTDDLPF